MSTGVPHSFRRPQAKVLSSRLLEPRRFVQVIAAFAQAFKVHRSLLVGGDGIPVEDFLMRPAIDWVGP